MLNLDNKEINKLLKEININDEFEIMFNNYAISNKLSITQFYDILKYIKYKSELETLKLNKVISLDIMYSTISLDKSSINYRFSLLGLEKINSFINLIHKKRNNDIFSILVIQFIDDPDVLFIRKEKKYNNLIDLNDYDIRIRKSSEKEVKKLKDSDKIIETLKKLSIGECNKISFRFKQRLSLSICDNLKETLNLDATITQVTNDINLLYNTNKIYEVELDYMIKKEDTNAIKSLKKINEEVIKVKKVLSKSNNILGKTESEDILKKYKEQVYGSLNYKYLYSMQPISAEVQHIIDNVPHNYSATDKADGEKHILYIYMGHIYLLSNNLSIRKTKFKTTDKSLEGTILEGELIYLTKSSKYLFMIFDCLFEGLKDIRIEPLLENRLKKINNILTKLNLNSYYKYKRFLGKFDLKKIIKHYNQEIIKFYDEIDKNIKNSKINDILLFPKFFINSLGGDFSEIFAYSNLIWENCTQNKLVKCPYKLDGIIYTGLEQKYTNDKKEHKFPIYKYKPPENNSIDVYIKFKKNQEKGTFLEIFDDSLNNVIKGTTYRVTELMVGDCVGINEIPVPFMKEEDNNEAYFPLKDGNVRDIEGNIIQNDTVIEITYDHKSKLPHKYRWIFLRTRWDKTDSVNRFKKKYGNFKTTAIKTWKSIKEAVTIDEIKNLAEPSLYMDQRNILKHRLDTSTISISRAQDKYYQKQSNLGKNMRQFANWIKSIIIYTYCSPNLINKGDKYIKKTILDMGVGRGGDIMKYFHARVKDVVGFDPNYENIYSSFDSALSRYNDVKSRFPQFPKMDFIQADAGVELTSDIQNKKILNYSKESYKIIDKIIGNKKFDVISSQFAIHYLFKNDESLNNLLNNIKTHLKKDGYILLTLFDAETVLKKLDKDIYTSYYTDENGKKNKFFEIKKKFKGKLKNNTGNSIDVFMNWVSIEGTYYEEYLVSKDYMIKTMEKIGCRLVDTDLFQNIYTMNKEYFNKVIEYEENPKNKKFYQNIAKFFGELKGIDKEGKKWQFLFRYYIFQMK